jgi:aminoglycoside phosphotransferase (APT) family kinase protein
VLGLALRAAGVAVTAPRAVGVRIPYAGMPGDARGWVDDLLGSPVVSTHEQVGGMSPGNATRVVCADGTRAFVKGVGTDLNPLSPGMYRREATVLQMLGRQEMWAGLLGSRDDGSWVVLVLEDVEGAHPDLADDAVMGRLLADVERLSAVLAERVPVVPTPDPGGGGLNSLRDLFTAWADAVARLDEVPEGLAPRWLVDQADDVATRVRALAEVPMEHLVHWDIRNDNLLQRPDGSIVFVDWGQAGVGPDWLDPLLARLERVEHPWFDASLAGSPALARAGDELVTTWLLGFGGALAYRAHVAVDVNLPTLNDFRRRESARFLTGAARRLGLPADLGGSASRC